MAQNSNRTRAFFDAHKQAKLTMKPFSFALLLVCFLTRCTTVEVANDTLSLPISANAGLAAGNKRWASCSVFWNSSGTWTPAQTQAATEAMGAVNNAKTFIVLQKNTNAQITVLFAPAEQVGKNDTEGLLTYRRPALAVIEGSVEKGFKIVLNQAHPWTPAQLKAVIINQLGEIMGLPVSSNPNSVMFPLINLANPVTLFSDEDLAALKQLYPGNGLPTVTTGMPYLPTNAKTQLVDATVTNAAQVPLVASMGLCWSSINATPTLDNADGRITTATKGLQAQSISLWELKSGTRYHLRAYAQNNCGTSYGNVITYTKP